MRVRNLALTPSVTAMLLVSVAPPAHAGIPGLARSNVVFYNVLNNGVEIGVTVCATGSADDPPTILGEFALTVVAVRDDGSQVIDPRVFPAPSFSYCRTVEFDRRTDHGSLSVVVTYGGAGVDVTTLAWGVAAWSPTTNGATWMSFGV